MTTYVNPSSINHHLAECEPAPERDVKVTDQHALPHAGTPLARQAGASVDNFLAWMLLAVVVAAAIFGAYYVLNKDTENNQEAQNIAQLRRNSSSLIGRSRAATASRCVPICPVRLSSSA
ncbi:hypothetical protein G6F31_018889 [Rhizopus arrhizus]|nr:hypothetical protein G6F31_018889 [Rhizopus arrhizus]